MTADSQNPNSIPIAINRPRFEKSLLPTGVQTFSKYVFLAIGAALLTSWIASYWLLSPSPPDNYEYYGCGFGLSPTFEDLAMFLTFLNVLGAVAGVLTYVSRKVSRKIHKADVEMEGVPMTPVTEIPAPEREFVSLTKMRVASPCKAEWRWMYGTDRVRFCGQCRKNVYNLSAMTKDEAEDLIRKTEGQLCVRFYRREDGTVLTQNCPVGLRALKRRLSRFTTAVATALLGFFANVGLVQWLSVLNVNASGSPVVTEGESFTGLAAPPLGSIRKLYTVQRSEDFIRERAISREVPVLQPVIGEMLIDARVVVKVVISGNGDVVEAACITGHPLLWEAAAEAAYQWRFEPISINNKPAVVESVLTFQIGR